MPRTCDVNGCKERGDHIEGWSVPQFTSLVILWFCDRHYEQSLAHSDDLNGFTKPARIDGVRTEARAQVF